MASPRVVTSAETDGTTAATNVVVNLPGSLVSGNVLILMCRKATGTQTTPTGWSELRNSSADGSDDNILICWKKSDGAEGATVTINGGASGKFAAASWQFTDCADPVAGPAFPPKIATEVTGTSTAPDSGNLDVTGAPAWGTFLHTWGALGSWEGEQTDPPTYPASYTHGQAAGQSGTAGVATTNCRVAGGWNQAAASTAQDPGAFTISVSDDWSASTLAVPGVLRHLRQLVDTTDTTTYTTASFTPYNGELLFVFDLVTNAAETGTLTSSAGITFTLISEVQVSAAWSQLWVANEFSDGTATTVTITKSGSAPTGAIIFVGGVHGMFRTGVDAVVQSANNSGGAGVPPAITFGTSVLQDNPTVVWARDIADPAALTPPTNWIEEADVGIATPTIGAEYATRGRTFTGTAVTWGSNAAGNWHAIGVEFDISAVPSTGVPNSLMMMGCGI